MGFGRSLSAGALAALALATQTAPAAAVIYGPETQVLAEPLTRRRLSAALLSAAPSEAAARDMLRAAEAAHAALPPMAWVGRRVALPGKVAS